MRARVSSLCVNTLVLLPFVLWFWTQETPLLLSMLGRSLILIPAQPWNHRSGTIPRNQYLLTPTIENDLSIIELSLV